MKKIGWFCCLVMFVCGTFSFAMVALTVNTVEYYWASGLGSVICLASALISLRELSIKRRS